MVTRNNADLPRYTEARKTKVAHRLLTNQERSNAMRSVESCDPNEPVCPDEVVHGEDGKYKPFRLFCLGNAFFHVHYGQEECTPSAKVFNGGFHCFGCAKTFACVRTPAKEPTFPFYSEDINQSTNYYALMLTIDWEVKMAWKFCVIHAPMGAGKTHQLSRLVNQCVDQGLRVCLLSFRVMLVKQQAKRLGLKCYLNLFNDELEDAPDYLVVSINSLWKVGYAQNYDVVLFDEAGFIRRHFLSITCLQKLTRIYDRFVNLVKDAKFVVMVQDGISPEDVRFYMEICGISPTNREQVAGVSFEKPVHIHPITYTTDVWNAVHNLVEALRNAYNDEGTCIRPFMVFCNQVNFCEFLVKLLMATAKDIPRVD